MNLHKINKPYIDEGLKFKAKMLTSFVFVLFGFLMFRLVNMQIFNGQYYEGLSRNNRLRIIDIEAPRGKILDRNGIILADNRPAYNIMVMPQDISDADAVSSRIAGLLQVNAGEIRKKIDEATPKPYDPVCIARDISFDHVAIIESEIFTLPGVSIEAVPERDYVYEELASHILGFLGEISKKGLTAYKEGDYAIGDLIGKSGIELICEERLRGAKGKRIFEVDALGRKIHVLDEHLPDAGETVTLTIDKRLQLIASNSLGKKAGAVVAIVPSTGEILAMVSSPTFDPNMFVSPMTKEMWKEIIEDPMHPLENRALRGQYPPGSIFKIAVSFAALSTHAIDPEEELNCPGDYTLGANTYRCWKTQGHQDVDMIKAIRESCDVYFYKLGEALGIDVISQFAQELGFGRPTGIELSDEVSGLIPTRQWKLKRFNTSWKPGETIITAIGQGFTLVTPLQVAKAMSSIVNGGRLYTPKILISSDTVLEKEFDIGLDDIDIIKTGMREVVEGKLGTARGIRDPMFSIGGKTGTAQVVRGVKSRLMDESDLPYKHRDHAWFFGFSPVENPEILVVAVGEHGGHGGSIAAPVVRDVIKGYYFLKGTSNE